MSPFIFDILPFVIGAILSGVLVVYAAKKRTVPATQALANMLLAIFIWSVGYIFETLATTVQVKLFWTKVEFLGIAPLPVMWLQFGFYYRYNLEKAQRYANVLLCIPLVTILLAWTNEYHHWMWSQVSINPEFAPSTLVLHHGVWFSVHVTYSYICLLVGVVFMVWGVIRQLVSHGWQSIGILVGLIMPWCMNILMLRYALIHLDITILGFVLSGCLFALAIFTSRKDEIRT